MWRSLATPCTDSAPAFDLDNNPRPAGANHDIGAYER
ncbi:choice-of-anchor Q domain-containing protein [Kibdelosporangium philippinense]